LDTLVLHDYFATAEGGGRLCRVLADAVEADLAYGFARLPHPFVFGMANNRREIDLALRSVIPLWQQFKLARGFAGFRPSKNYDVAVYSGFYTPLAVPVAKKNVLYCHTPPRFVYDQRDFYLAAIPAPLRPVLNAFSAYLQPRYEAAVRRMDVVLTNSHNVRRRIQTFLGVDATVVYPPCDTERFRWLEQGDYYLSTARLDPLKRVDQIVRAFLQMPDKTLVVASGGSELRTLKKIAGGAANIHFTGWVDEARLANLVGRALAVIYLPKDEDFGMSPVEAMAAGKPVIGVAEGGLLESITEESGILLAADFDIEAIKKAVRGLTAHEAEKMRHACEKRAQDFRHAVFVEHMQAQLGAGS
jgi:glycosyltransferase involved in cell wall biosynthesis